VAQLAGKRIASRPGPRRPSRGCEGCSPRTTASPLDEIRWVTFEDGHLAEFPDPPGVERARPGAKAVDLLLAGELDAAIIGSDLPDEPRLQPVLPDPARRRARVGRQAPHGSDQPYGGGVGEPDSRAAEIVRELYGLLQQSKAMAAPASESALIYAFRHRREPTGAGSAAALLATTRVSSPLLRRRRAVRRIYPGKATVSFHAQDI